MRTREACAALDAADPLHSRRALFALAQGDIYLDGNSLGPPPHSALERLEAAARHEWGAGLIGSWNAAGWMDLPLKLGARLSRLIGVESDEVIAIDTVTVNIFKLAGALIAREGGALAAEAGEFPTDGHVLEGLSRISGAPFHRVTADTPPSQLPDDVRVLVKSAVHYKSARIADFERWEREAAARGIAIIWDLSHATGLVNLKLKAWGAKYAVGCGYKFLNGGPGAPAFLYCARDEIARLEHPVSGWLGHKQPFEFEDGYAPADGIGRWRTSSPSILALSALDGALDAYDGVDMALVEAKAQVLGDILLERAASLGLETACPGLGERRGGHVVLRHEQGYAIVQAMIARGITGDFRAPDLMRYGFNPLYLSHEEVFDAGAALAEVIETREWDQPQFTQRKAVT
ncbi:kynureninase [Alkalicaulis satelles]|uniref:Kynureninase n=1 Tax=Alkalicaulis satelles TaxID=2609175 RepID=A0A5M6ZJA8_9PROT|nr:kynureninase [Alkalicaulis satelles]KAA5803328.1 kynureninase [Alkalicaulis satelles]